MVAPRRGDRCGTRVHDKRSLFCTHIAIIHAIHKTTPVNNNRKQKIFLPSNNVCRCPLSGTRPQRSRAPDPRTSSSAIQICLLSIPPPDLSPWHRARPSNMQSLPSGSLSAGDCLSRQTYGCQQLNLELWQLGLQALAERTMQEGRELRVSPRV